MKTLKSVFAVTLPALILVTIFFTPVVKADVKDLSDFTSEEQCLDYVADMNLGDDAVDQCMDQAY